MWKGNCTKLGHIHPPKPARHLHQKVEVKGCEHPQTTLPSWKHSRIRAAVTPQLLEPEGKH